MAREAQRRLYFALWPEDALRAAIVRVAAPAVAAVGGRAEPPANLHVTLAFLGGVPASRCADAIVAAQRVTAGRGTQTFDRVLTWGRAGPLVLEATRVEPALAALEAALRNSLLAADFALDRRDFRPHITLARAPARRAPPAPANVTWPYRDFVLVESRTGPAGSRYAVVETFPLA